MFYNKFITGIVLKLGGQTTKVMDKGTVEYLGPYGLEKGLLAISKNISELNTGLAPTYGLYIVIAIMFFGLSTYTGTGIHILIIGVSLFLVLYSQGLEGNNNPKPHSFASSSLRSSMPGSDPEDSDTSDDSRNTEDLASQNLDALEKIAEYKDLRDELYGLKDIADKLTDQLTDEDKEKWNKVAENENCDLGTNITRGELMSEIRDVEERISDLKDDLANNHYGGNISDSGDSSDELSIFPISVNLPVITILLTLDRALKSHPITCAYYTIYKNSIVNKFRKM